jgi:hypothetical protein
MNDYKLLLEQHKNRMLAGNRSLSPEKRAMLMDPTSIIGLSTAQKKAFLKKKARGKRYGEGSLEEGGEKDEEQKNSDMAKRVI